MLFSDTRFTFDKIIRLTITVGIVWACISVLGYLSDVLVPFVTALIMAYLIHPLVVFIQKQLPSRQLAVFASLLLVFSCGAGIIMFLAPLVGSEIRHMGQLLHQFATNSALAQKAATQLPAEIWAIVKDIIGQEELKTLFKSDQALQFMQLAAKKILPGLWGAVKGAKDLLLGITGLAVILLYMIFLLLDFEKVRESWQTLLPEQWRIPAKDFVNDFEGGMNRYFRAQAVVAGIVGILFATGFALMGLPLGILLGLFIGLLNMVPYLQTLGLIPAALLGIMHWLETDVSLATTFGLILLIFAVVQIIQDAFLVPRIMGDATGLSPWMIMLSLSVWGKLLGLLGLLIALPMTVLCLSYYRRVIPEIESATPKS